MPAPTPHRLQVSGYYGGPLFPSRRAALAELRRIVKAERKACRRKFGRALSYPRNRGQFVEISPNGRACPDHMRTLWISVSISPEPRSTHGARI